MDGILIIDKPAGLTSHDVVARVRRILKTRRVGHTGTLDPFATGVLILCLGRATRLVQFLVGADKRYHAVARLGYATDTQDLTGKPITPVRASDEIPISSLSQVLHEFQGRQLQLPPMYSAKKVAGVALYKAARRGTEIDRPPVEVEVFEIGLNPTTWVSEAPDGTREFGFDVHCASGTYIRTLAHDIGDRLGVGAHLTALRRTAVDGFTAATAVTLDQLAAAAEMGTASDFILPLTVALPHLARIELPPADARRLIHGQKVPVDEPALTDGQAVQLISQATLVGIARYAATERVLIPWVIVADTESISS